jgi:hypothetical protein
MILTIDLRLQLSISAKSTNRLPTSYMLSTWMNFIVDRLHFYFANIAGININGHKLVYFLSDWVKSLASEPLIISWIGAWWLKCSGSALKALQ